MSGLGNGYDNAVPENLFHSLKVELTAGHSFEDRGILRQELFVYI
jgi:hypothetical protein